jgi:hypothetical protein
MAEVARKEGIPFVDVTPSVAGAAERFSFEDLFTPDRHPSPLTCEVMARAVVNTMIELRLFQGASISDLWNGLSSGKPRASPLEFAGSLSTGLSVQVKTDPGRRVHFFLSFKEGTTDLLGHRIALARDALFEKTIDPANPTLTQTTAGADGVARLLLTPILGPDAKPGVKIHACAAIFGLNGGPGLHDLTPSKAFEIP